MKTTNILHKSQTLTISPKVILQNVLFALALTTCVFLNIHTHIDCEAKELHNIIELVRKEDDKETDNKTVCADANKLNQINTHEIF